MAGDALQLCSSAVGFPCNAVHIFNPLTWFLCTELSLVGRRLTSYVGETMTISCRPRAQQDVDWRHRATERGFEDYIYSNGVMYERFRDRMSVVRSRDGDYNLVISNVSVNDSGIYICIEESGLGTGYIYRLTVSGNTVLLIYHTLFQSVWVWHVADITLQAKTARSAVIFYYLQQIILAH